LFGSRSNKGGKHNSKESSDMMRFQQGLLVVGIAGVHGAAASCDAAICDAYKIAYKLEGGELTAPPAGVPAGPWCKVGESIITGLSAASEGNLLNIEPCTLVPTTAGIHEFEHQHTNYTTLGNGKLDVTCFSYLEPQDNAQESITLAAKSVDCKMVDATRVAQQLGVTTDTTVQCLEVNKKAIEVAKKLLPSSVVQTHESSGRPFCLKDDAGVPFSIGPLWVKKAITLTDTAKSLEVTSTKLISTIHSLICPGNHYCKLLSPARAMDWIVTDSLKPYNPCDGCAETIAV